MKSYKDNNYQFNGHPYAMQTGPVPPVVNQTTMIDLFDDLLDNDLHEARAAIQQIMGM